MSPRAWGHRFVTWGNDNPFFMAIIFDLLIVAAGLWAFQIQNDNSIERVRIQAAAEAEARAAAVAASSKEVCIRAITAVTNQGKADDLTLIKGIKDRFTESGRPVPAVYLNLELLITNRQPPVAACEPKENP